MKDQLSIIILVAAFIVLGFRIYQKYVRKEPVSKEGKVKKDASFPESVKDDDYEPYSKGRE
jgi:hypothetical protein